MLNSIPVVGWILDFVFKISLAIPFWIVWTICGIGRCFFDFLPANYLAPGFWEIFGLFVVLGILKGFSPLNVSSTGGDAKAESR